MIRRETGLPKARMEELRSTSITTEKLRYAYDVYNRNVSVAGDDFTQKNHYDVHEL